MRKPETDEPRTAFCSIVLTEEEQRKIRVAAALNRKSMSRYLRDLGLRDAAHEIERGFERRARPQLSE
jgi:hypothetical protein